MSQGFLYHAHLIIFALSRIRLLFDAKLIKEIKILLLT